MTLFLNSASVDMTTTVSSNAASEKKIICFTYMVEQFEFQTIDCRKQILGLRTAGYTSKGKY